MEIGNKKMHASMMKYLIRLLSGLNSLESKTVMAMQIKVSPIRQKSGNLVKRIKRPSIKLREDHS